MEEIKEYQGTVLNVRMPTGDIEPIVSDAYTPSSQKLLEEYLIDGTADLQELINNNGIIIENIDGKKLLGGMQRLGTNF